MNSTSFLFKNVFLSAGFSDNLLSLSTTGDIHRDLSAGNGDNIIKPLYRSDIINTTLDIMKVFLKRKFNIIMIDNGSFNNNNNILSLLLPAVDNYYNLPGKRKLSTIKIYSFAGNDFSSRSFYNKYIISELIEVVPVNNTVIDHDRDRGDIDNKRYLLIKQATSNNKISGSVFINGNYHNYNDFLLLNRFISKTPCYPIASTGGVAETIYSSFFSSSNASRGWSYTIDNIERELLLANYYPCLANTIVNDMIENNK